VQGGLTKASREVPSQGEPHSPLLSNIMLDDLDKSYSVVGSARAPCLSLPAAAVMSGPYGRDTHK
jgi:hypothetical protein